MIAWYWVLIAGFGGFFLGIFAICIFITGGRESGSPEKNAKTIRAAICAGAGIDRKAENSLLSSGAHRLDVVDCRLDGR